MADDDGRIKFACVRDFVDLLIECQRKDENGGSGEACAHLYRCSSIFRGIIINLLLRQTAIPIFSIVHPLISQRHDDYHCTRDILWRVEFGWNGPRDLLQYRGGILRI